jgi:hypothetical protein
MESVPNIVRERLKAAASDHRHPDADVLTAFAEESLPAPERTAVIEHLARCGDCRHVLALALPELSSPEVLAQKEPVEAPIRPSPVRWLTWPALRWGIVAAGVAVIVSFGVFEYRQQPPQATMIAKQSPSAEPMAQPQVPAVAAPGSALPSNEPKRTLANPQASAAGQALSATSPKLQGRLESHATALAVPPATNALHNSVNGGSGSGIGGAFSPKMPAQWQQKQQQSVGGLPALNSAAPVMTRNSRAGNAAAQNNQAASGTAPAASETVEANSGAAPTQTQSTNQTSSADQAATQLASAQLPNDESLSLSKAKPVSVPPPPRAMPADTVSLPRWTISPTGALQRSLDEGKTWQDIDVTSPANAGMSLGGPLKTPSQPEGYAKDTLKQVTSPIFRAVAAAGAEVWAGGSGGVLYHSIDAGGHWMRVVPSSAGAVLTGDIIGLEFSDLQHGRITTSTEVWTTSDDGQTWQKQ